MSRKPFSDAEIEAVARIFHDYAVKMTVALESGAISEGQFRAHEELYEKVMYFIEGKELQ